MRVTSHQVAPIPRAIRPVTFGRNGWLTSTEQHLKAHGWNVEQAVDAYVYMSFLAFYDCMLVYLLLRIVAASLAACQRDFYKPVTPRPPRSPRRSSGSTHASLGTPHRRRKSHEGRKHREGMGGGREQNSPHTFRQGRYHRAMRG